MSDLPAHCRIAAQFNTSSSSTVHFELWMPAEEEWNNRFLVVGNGGWAGAINYPGMGRGLRSGFAGMSTNAGHNSTADDGTWFRNEEESIDFGHRALHLSIEYSKQLIEAYYSRPTSWSYYMGGSTGGRQGLAEAQLYPEDFDGILVGCPVIWQTHLEAWENYVGKGQYPTTLDTYISADQWTSVHEEVLRQCDGRDGVKDGIISDPKRCDFTPESLLCGIRSNDASKCLTPAQLTNLKAKYNPWIDVNNTFVYPGIAPGAEELVQFYTNGPAPGGIGLTFYQNAILNDSTFEALDISKRHQTFRLVVSD
ncbi:Tannase/feruloyl esterase [Dactylonectria macrodidyma]|uniref:Carboxylic ester hydrolase n=1 Tax=Dactylonectria macrodidyma TaxID=307937 RepID=A0A9P9EFK3_9HYPO|nr:Tannase/feruloyl esterase [Dactylonectria macrodidyma]